MSSTKTERPDGCEEKHLAYLNKLRESGATNMFGARPYLMREFGDLTGEQALAILDFWMHDESRFA